MNRREISPLASLRAARSDSATLPRPHTTDRQDAAAPEQRSFAASDVTVHGTEEGVVGAPGWEAGASSSMHPRLSSELGGDAAGGADGAASEVDWSAEDAGDDVVDGEMSRGGGGGVGGEDRGRRGEEGLLFLEKDVRTPPRTYTLTSKPRPLNPKT